MRQVRALCLGGLLAYQPAAAHDLDIEDKEKLEKFINNYIKNSITKNLEVIDTIKKANKKRANWMEYKGVWRNWDDADAKKNPLTYDYFEYLWSRKRERKFRELFVGSSLSQKLRGVQKKSNGKILELFITDKRGGNVVQSDATSDWYQGDEKKFKNVHNKKETYYGKIKRDSTVKRSGLHASVPIWDGDEFLGAAIIFINLDSL